MFKKTPNQSTEKNLEENLKVENAFDKVERPAHYANRKFEVIDVMKDTMSRQQYVGYLLGCTVKYLTRWDKKENPLQDLKKAQWYLNKLIEDVEGER